MPPWIEEYKVVEWNEGEDSKVLVNEAIADGWQPFGGVQTSVLGGQHFWFHQAMVKYRQPEWCDQGAM